MPSSVSSAVDDSNLNCLVKEIEANLRWAQRSNEGHETPEGPLTASDRCSTVGTRSEVLSHEIPYLSSFANREQSAEGPRLSPDLLLKGSRATHGSILQRDLANSALSRARYRPSSVGSCAQEWAESSSLPASQQAKPATPTHSFHALPGQATSLLTAPTGDCCHTFNLGFPIATHMRHGSLGCLLSKLNFRDS